LFSGGSNPVIVSVVWTPRWLVLVVSDEKSEMSVLSAELKDMIANDYADSPAFRLIPDTGVEVEGVRTGRVGRIGTTHFSYLIGLGEEPVAMKFKQALFRAVQEMKKLISPHAYIPNLRGNQLVGDSLPVLYPEW